MTTVALAASVDAARRALGGAVPDVLLCVTCDEPLELSPRVGDDAALRRRASAAGVRVVELGDLIAGQHPLAWCRDDLRRGEVRVGAALGDVHVLELVADDGPARHVARVLLVVYPTAQVRTIDGVAVEVRPAESARPTRPGTARRVLRAVRVRVREAVVLGTAWRDLGSADAPDGVGSREPMLAPPDPSRGGP